jgi:hypothetical protein
VYNASNHSGEHSVSGARQCRSDYAETFAPVSRTTSLRLLLTIAATNDLEVRQADVEGAYLNGKLDVELYMAYPEGMKSKPDATPFGCLDHYMA